MAHLVQIGEDLHYDTMGLLKALRTFRRMRDPTDSSSAYVCYEKENGRRLNGSDHHQFALE